MMTVSFVSSVLVILLLPTFIFASPLPFNGRLEFPCFDQRGLLCRLPVIDKFLCPRQGTSGQSVDTPLGKAKGVLDATGATRFSVKYGSAARWAPSSIATTWQFPNGATNVSAVPLACPQPNVVNSSMSEDCLSMILYIPGNLNVEGGASVLMWIHGGSFIVGSATNPGLDGSKLAIATNSIVAVVQYRLGALGFLGPDGSTNLGLKDIVTALQFLQKVSPSFGGSAGKITVAGQSSGASMIRALLAVPSASSLFRSAILQSDSMDYGFLSTSVQQKIQAYFNNGIKCGGTDKSCLNALSLDTILNAQTDIFDNAFSDIDPSAGQGEPIRLVHDGSFITSPLDSTAPFPRVSKPVLISTVRNEAGSTIYSAFPDPLPQTMFEQVVDATFGSPRTQQITTSSRYAVPVSNGGNSKATVDARVRLEQLGTDYLWKCSSWTFARNWVQHGGSAFVGMYVVGATYPGNEAVSFCTEAGVVCHQDDIEIVFGTVPNPTAAQAKLIKEMQARYKAFLSTGNPNSSGSSLAKWSPATTTDVHALTLGGSGEVAVGACDPSFWGQAVLYDYQVFNI